MNPLRRPWRQLAVAIVLQGPLASAALAEEPAGGLFSITSPRPYLHLRLGEAFFTGDGNDAGVELKSPSVSPVAGASIGADLGPHLGLEIAADHVKTDLDRSAGGSVGDYAITSLAGLVRFRYPLLDGDLVPYLLGGGGIGYGEFSGREDFTFSAGGEGFAPLGVVGAGIEYLVDDAVALGFEVRHTFGFFPDVRVGAEESGIDASNTAVFGGVRLYFDKLAMALDPAAPDPTPARDSGALRGYLSLRGGLALFTDTDPTPAGASPAVEMEDTSGVLLGASLGLNLNEYLGAELSSEYMRAQLTSTSPAIGDVSGYPLWTVLGLARLRYPLFDGRLSPYALAGGGIGVAIGGTDRDTPFQVSGFSSSGDRSWVAALGGGIDYFIEDNIALTIEAKHVFLFDTSITLNGQPGELSPDYLSLTGGLRFLFP